MTKFDFTVTEEFCKERIDVFLTAVTEFTRSHVRTVIDEGLCMVSNKPVKQNYRVKTGDNVSLEVPLVKETAITVLDLRAYPHVE